MSASPSSTTVRLFSSVSVKASMPCAAMANCFSKLSARTSPAMSPRKVISASASMENSTESVSICAVMRSAASTSALSLPVMCRRSKPSSPFTEVVMPLRVEKAAVVSTVMTSSPRPPSRLKSVFWKSALSDAMWSVRNCTTSWPRLKARAPAMPMRSLPSPPRMLTCPPRRCRCQSRRSG